MTIVHDSPSGQPLEVVSEGDLAARPIATLWFGTDPGVFPVLAFFIPFEPNGTITEANAQLPAPVAGVLRNLRIVVPGTLVASSGDFTLRVNGVNSALTCNISTPDTSGEDTTHQVAVAQGALLSLGVASDGALDFGSAGWASVELYEA